MYHPKTSRKRIWDKESEKHQAGVSTKKKDMKDMDTIWSKNHGWKRAMRLTCLSLELLKRNFDVGHRKTLWMHIDIEKGKYGESLWWNDVTNGMVKSVKLGLAKTEK